MGKRKIYHSFLLANDNGGGKRLLIYAQGSQRHFLGIGSRDAWVHQTAELGSFSVIVIKR